MLDYQENKQEEGLGSAFLKSVFTLDVCPIQCIYFILSFKKLGLLTSAGVSGGLGEVSLGSKFEPSDKMGRSAFIFWGRPSEKEARPQFPKSLAGDGRLPEIISRRDKFDK